MNNMIKASIDKVLSVKPSTITLDATLKEGLIEVLELLIAGNIPFFTIKYFSSGGPKPEDKLYDVKDHITYEKNSGKLKVVHKPTGYKDNNLRQGTFKVTPQQYPTVMKAFQSITFLQIDYHLESETQDPSGKITFNVFQKVESPMTRRWLDEFSYVTTAKARNQLMIDCQPKNN